MPSSYIGLGILVTAYLEATGFLGCFLGCFLRRFLDSFLGRFLRLLRRGGCSFTGAELVALSECVRHCVQHERVRRVIETVVFGCSTHQSSFERRVRLATRLTRV